MRFEDIEGGVIPGIKRYTKERLSPRAMELMEFVNLNVKAKECIFTENEYSSVKSAQNSINGSAKNYGIPVHAVIRGEKVYLERTDM